MKLLIAGDLALQGRLKNIEWSTSALEYAFSEVKKISAQCDHSIINLESPVTDSNRKILKDGPTLKNPLSVFDIICYCGFDIITLANNHLNDYGDKGVMDTIHRCKEHNLISIGAGSIVDEARKPLVISEKGDMVIGVINACEHESSIATTTQAGSNPLDFVNLYYDITDLIGSDKRVAVTCLESGSDQGAVLSIVNIKLTSENPTKNGSGAEPRIVWDEELIEFVEAVHYGILGDADHDGCVCLMDALAVMRSVLNGTSLGVYGAYCADMNRDGVIDMTDALSLMHLLLG